MRAVMAGFAKFFPMPPKSIFTATIAVRQPNAACHSGMETGRLYASSTPVTTADRSPTVTGIWQSFSYPNSNSTQQPAQNAVTSSARHPKMTIAAISAGESAISTSRIMTAVVHFVLICGEADKI